MILLSSFGENKFRCGFEINEGRRARIPAKPGHVSTQDSRVCERERVYRYIVNPLLHLPSITYPPRVVYRVVATMIVQGGIPSSLPLLMNVYIHCWHPRID